MLKENNKSKLLLRAILIFVVYLFYTPVITSLLEIIGIHDDAVNIFVSDLLFFFGIVYVYRNNIKDGYLNFFGGDRQEKEGDLLEMVYVRRNNQEEERLKISKEHVKRKRKSPFLHKLWLVIKWVLILFVVNMIGSIVTELLFPTLAGDDGNTISIYNLASISMLYTLFKTLVFAIVAEELVFKKTIRDVIDNKWLFIVISSLVYAIVNVMYTEISISTLAPFVSYFISSSVLGFAYVQNDDNIFIVMLIKFTYNLIPLSLLLLEMGV